MQQFLGREEVNDVMYLTRSSQGGGHREGRSREGGMEEGGAGAGQGGGEGFPHHRNHASRMKQSAVQRPKAAMFLSWRPSLIHHKNLGGRGGGLGWLLPAIPSISLGNNMHTDKAYTQAHATNIKWRCEYLPSWVYPVEVLQPFLGSRVSNTF